MDFITGYYHKFVDSLHLTHLYSGPTSQWGTLEWFFICLLLFVPLAFVFPGKRGQPYIRRDMLADGIYWFVGPLFYGPVFMIIANFFVSLAAIRYIQAQWHLQSLPLIVQAVLILLMTDFLQYWAHRAFHGSALWKFHAIHHSSPHIDWMSAARFHPVNIILYSSTINALVATLGFNFDAILLLVPFNAIYSPLVHANLNWNYGPFKYILASPVFHRWHHTHPHEGGNKNFAPTFPFIDLMFGTFYMPKGVQPQVFGTPDDPITGNFFQQMVYPFKTKRAPETIKIKDLS